MVELHFRNKTLEWAEDNSTDKEEINRAQILGIDFKTNKLHAKNGNEITSDLDISETEIIAQKEQVNVDSEFFDNIQNTIQIDRLTGLITHEANYSQNGKFLGTNTQSGSCDLLKVENRKF